MKKPLVALLSLALLPSLAHAGVTPSFEASAKLTCFSADGVSSKLKSQKLDTNALIANAQNISPAEAENLYLAYVDGFFLILDRCSNGMVRILAEPFDCVGAGSKTMDRACSLTFDDWATKDAPGRTLCRVHVAASNASGSCDGEVDPDSLGPCRIQFSIHGIHKIPRNCAG
ncbi:MAG TPA: hypothetical protein VMR50_06820 [Myxococcota bacterium]|nr:hypothetical protein [Myxococcota bacterium]